ncbi:wd-40 repeat protein [Stylonychia lemnae]|uniref:Wd-40 repeat protein n=1 Tax=Stylonychia lemnae TaxID=5949 RepID=A0A078ACA6_STYLE|nr:wd-40 repeat protein [Stylonychia lemnae]|eukprot:CDW79849.1 wd-40 repeat protein [Stylonychia lemnae]
MDYSKENSRIKALPFKFEKAGRKTQVKQLILIVHRNLIIVVYYYDNAYTTRTIDFLDFNSLQVIKTIDMVKVSRDTQLFYRPFNEVDYIFYQNGQTMQFAKLDDYIDSQTDIHLMEFKYDNSVNFHNVDIIDEFTIMISSEYYTQLFKLDKPLEEFNKDNKAEFNIKFLGQQEYGNLKKNQINQLLVKNENESFYQLRRNEDYNVQCYFLKNQIIFHKNESQKTLFVDKNTMIISYQIDKKYYGFKHLELYEYVLDSDFNIYENNNKDGITLKKIQQLHDSRIDNIHKIVTTPTRFIVLSENQTSNYTLHVFDSLTFQLINYLSKFASSTLDFYDIETINQRFYFKNAQFQDQIVFFDFSTNIRQNYDLLPVLDQGYYENIFQFCIMKNQYHEKQYIFDLIQKNKIIYFDKLNQSFKEIDLIENVIFQQQQKIPIDAIINEELRYLVVKSLSQVTVFNLEEKSVIKEISGDFANNSSQGTNISFIKNRIIVKTIQLQLMYPLQNIETVSSQQKEFNEDSFYLFKRIDQGQNPDIYNMRVCSFENMFNQDLLVQPVYPSFYFDYANKITINSSQIQIFIKGEKQMVGFFQTDINDQLIKYYREMANHTNEEIIKDITSNVDKYIKFVAGYGTGFGVFQNNLAALEMIVKQLSFKEKQSIPILICQKMLGGESALDFSIKNQQQKIINIILSMIIKYQDHIMFNKLVDKNLCELIKQQIDLQEYFQSNLSSYEILQKSFPSQHHDEQELIEGINLENPKDVHDKYDELFGGKLEDLNEGNETLVSIEYHLINLPQTLRNNPQQLMQVLSETERPEYFENQVIQAIIKFKWNKYTKSFYQNRFYIYLIFMASFIFDIFYSVYATQNDQEKSEQKSSADLDTEILQPNIWIKISSKIICSLVLLFFLIYELKQISVQKGSYFSDGWNYFDFSHIIAYTTFCILDFTNEDKINLILIKILVIVLTFMKLFFFLRIYDGFSFLVSMMAGVFKDLKYFLIFFIIFILQFGMIFLVLFKAQQIDEYNGVNKLAYFLMAFRISSGDFQLDDFHTQEDLLVVFTWIIWLIAVMTLNIVFMNFIIAVISESYERVMQKLVAESYRVKAHMIVEREQLFSNQDLQSQKYFPNFIVARRPLNTESNESGEWQGFIKDIKYTIRTTAAKSKAEILQNLNSLQTQNKENGQKLEKIDEAFEQNSKILKINENLEEQISKVIKLQLDQSQENSKNEFTQLKADIDNKVSELDTKVLKIQDDMEFIKSSLTQLLQKQNS